jgi:hypothetical protein
MKDEREGQEYTVEVYTGGSKSPDGVGAVIAIFKKSLVASTDV